MYKTITAIVAAGTLSACSTASTEGDLDNAPVNVSQVLCLFNCSVEAALEKTDSEGGSSAVGGALSETSENSGSLSIPEL